MVEFDSFVFDENEEWKAYLRRLDPRPEGQVLHKRKQRWFKEHIDSSYIIKPVVDTTQNNDTTDSYSSYSQPDTDADGAALRASIMISTAFMVLATLPYVNKLNIPTFIGPDISVMNMACIWIAIGHASYCLGRITSWKSLMTVDGWVNGFAGYHTLHLLCACNAILCGVWICAAPAFLALFQVYSSSQEFRGLFNDILRLTGSQLAHRISPEKQEAFLTEVLFQKMDALIARTHITSVISLIIFTLLNWTKYHLSFITTLMVFRICYINGPVLRNETLAMNQYFKQKLPEPLRTHYGQFTSLVYRYTVESRINS